MSESKPFSLRDIASWQIPEFQESARDFYARVPSLQRGSAWEPQQVEMFWDSVFRGFPVGSLVLVKRIVGQHDKNSSCGTNLEISASHHILDGQQRCNAVALGYLDPINCKNNPQVLWLDLCWQGEKTSTRKYLFRLTNMAHPWGFDKTENSGFLGVAKRREFIEKLEKTSGEKYKEKRPSPQNSYPADASFPVPVYLLFRYFNSDSLDWDSLQKDEKIKRCELWSGRKVLDLDEHEKSAVIEGLKKATNASMVGIIISDDFSNHIEDVEKIFQRLNSQGTPINNEDLAYSMMKAYWPDLDNFMSGIKRKPIHESRLAGLGIRVALTEKNASKLYPAMSIDRIRSVFSEKQEDSKIIRRYFSEEQKDSEIIRSVFSECDAGIKSALHWIDSNLLYRGEDDCGIPSYLRSSIAWSSPEVFAWWMWLAKELDYQEIGADDPLRKRILAFSLIIHWLGLDKPKAVDCLISQLAAFKSGSLFISEIRNETNQMHVLSPLHPYAMSDVLQVSELMNEEQLANYTSLWHGVVAFSKFGVKRSKEEQEKEQGLYWEFVNRICHQRELLIYIQRAEIKRIFEDFDPSDKLMWKGHNRPWDYDHILPSNELNARGKKYQKYTECCQTWQRTIGNLIAVDFSFNREAKDTVGPTEKYGDEKMITDRFNIKFKDTDDHKKSVDFIMAVSSRFLGIYKAWFDGLGVGDLLENR